MKTFVRALVNLLWGTWVAIGIVDSINQDVAEWVFFTSGLVYLCTLVLLFPPLNQAARSVALQLSLATFLGFLVGSYISRKQREETNKIGEVVVEALKAFHADQQRFPESLEELVPNYLESVPRPTRGLFYGQDFHYGLIESHEHHYPFLGYSMDAFTRIHKEQGGTWSFGSDSRGYFYDYHTR